MELYRIRDLREDKDLTQAEVAEILHITKQQYQLYESGKRTIPVDLLIVLAKFYNVSLDFLAGIIPKPRALFDGMESVLSNDVKYQTFGKEVKKLYEKTFLGK